MNKMEKKGTDFTGTALPADSKRLILGGLETVETSAPMRVFRQLKQKRPGCLLLFRGGDFGSAFFIDAEDCSKVLGLELIALDLGDGTFIPMVEFNWQIIENNLKKLVEAGYKVATYEPIGKRDWVRIYASNKLTR